MKPSQVSSHLRRIASKIDGSSNPVQARVAEEIHQVISQIEQTAAPDGGELWDKFTDILAAGPFDIPDDVEDSDLPSMYKAREKILAQIMDPLQKALSEWEQALR